MSDDNNNNDNNNIQKPHFQSRSESIAWHAEQKRLREESSATPATPIQMPISNIDIQTPHFESRSESLAWHAEQKRLKELTKPIEIPATPEIQPVTEHWEDKLGQLRSISGANDEDPEIDPSKEHKEETREEHASGLKKISERIKAAPASADKIGAHREKKQEQESTPKPLIRIEKKLDTLITANRKIIDLLGSNRVEKSIRQQSKNDSGRVSENNFRQQSKNDFEEKEKRVSVYNYTRQDKSRAKIKKFRPLSYAVRKSATHLLGRGFGNAIAKPFEMIENGVARTVSGIAKAPFKIAAGIGKGIAKTVGRTFASSRRRDRLVAANRSADTSKFRKKMLELLGIISKKDSKGGSSVEQNTQSKGMSPLAIAAGIGAAILGIKALVDNMSKETKDKIKSFLYDIQEKMKDKAAKAAYEFQEYIKKWLYDNNPLKEFGEMLGAKIFDYVSALNGFGEKLGSKLFDIVNGIETAYKDAKEGVKTAITNTYNKAEEYAGKAADTAMDASTAVYKTITGSPDKVASMVKNSPPAKWLERKHNDHVANNKMPDYVSGMKDNKFAPNKEYNNIANSLSKPKASPSLKQLQQTQKQSDEIRKKEKKDSKQPIIMNNTTNNTSKQSSKEPNIVRLGTRNLDSSKQQFDRSVISGGYVGVGFLVN